MNPLNIFLNKQDRLRSGWRFAVFCAAYYVLFQALAILIYAGLFALDRRATADINQRLSGATLYLLTFIIEFVPALLLGWGFGRLFEGLPRRALGWARHAGWLRDLLIGSALGFASLALAALVATTFGGFSFQLAPEGFGVAFVKTLVGAILVYVLLAAAEEVTFRGYPLQTLMRSQPFVVAAIPTSLLFALVHHLFNPNVVPGFTFVNTALAGVWLAVAYWRTRSLWLPLGLHWSWNWAMGSVLGLPVSGITSLTRAPLVRAANTGPDWLTGGAYGIEGGAACTFALLVSTVFVWRTGLLRADAELKRFSDGEMPKKSPGDTGEIVI